MVNPAIDPTLGITPSIPFAYGDRPQNQWRLLPAPPRTKGGDVPNYQDHELIIFDLGGGLNKVRGRIFPHYLGVDLGDSNRTSSVAGIDVSYPGQAILDTLVTTETVYSGAAQYCWAYGYNNLFIGGGSTANQSLWQETANSVGLAAVTFSPGGAIVSLNFLAFNSAAPLLTIGMVGVAAKTLASDLTTTTSFNDTDTLWGAIVSPLGDNGATNILYLGSALVTVSTNADPTTPAAFKATGTSFNAGGYAVGIANVPVTPGNLVPRAVWVVPRSPSTSGVMAGRPLLPKCDIIHTNLYGTDPQYLITNLPYVTWCTINDGVLYYTDGFNIMVNDGKEQDLGWVYEREPDSTYKYVAVGLGFARGQLVVQCCQLNLSSAASSLISIEKYDSVAKTWFRINQANGPITGSTTTGTNTGPGEIYIAVTDYPIGSLPFSIRSSRLYWVVGAATHPGDSYQFIGPPGYSPFWNFRHTAGSSVAGLSFQGSGTWDSPALAFPFPLKGLPTVLIGMGIFGDLNAGGTGGTSILSSVTVQLATQGISGDITFSNPAITGVISHKVAARDGLRYEARWKSWIDEDGNINAPVDPFNLFKYRMTITQDDSRTDWTPNALPIVFHFRTYTNGRVD